MTRFDGWRKRLLNPRPASRTELFALEQAHLLLHSRWTKGSVEWWGSEDSLLIAIRAASHDALREFSRSSRVHFPKEVLPRVIEMGEEGRLEHLYLITLSADGRLRERAVRALFGCEGERVLAYLFPRLVDWVPEIRAVAAEIAKDRLAQTSTAELLSLLAAYGHWSVHEGLDPRSRAVFVALLDELQRKSRRGEVDRILTMAELGQQLRLLAALDGALHLEFGTLKTLIAAPVGALRAMAAQSLCDGERSLPESLILPLLRDRQALVVERLLLSIGEERLRSLRGALEGVLLSRRGRIRALIVRAIARAGGSPAALAREAIRSGDVKELPAALAVLLEWREGPDDEGLLREHLTHCDARVRCVAWTAGLRLQPEGHWQGVLKEVLEGDLREARVLARELGRVDRNLWEESLWERLRAVTTPLRKAICWRLLLGRPYRLGPRVLPAILSAAMDGHQVDRCLCFLAEFRGRLDYPIGRGSYLAPSAKARLADAWGRFRRHPLSSDPRLAGGALSRLAQMMEHLRVY